MMRKPRVFLSIAVIALAGCQGETAFEGATGKGSVRAINAISTSPDINFLIEERVITTVTFGEVSVRSQYDDLAYTFNFEVVLPGDTDPTRVASQALTIVADTDYFFLLSGSLAAPDLTLWQRPESELDSTSANFEAEFGHASPATGSLDVYLLDPATAPAVGNEYGSVAFGEVLPVASLAGGDYVLTLTDAGDPSAVVYTSDTLTLNGGSALLFTIFDTDANDIANTSVQMLNLTAGAITRLPDPSVPSTVRFHHASFNLGAVDIYDEDPLVAPVVSDHVFGNITPDIVMPSDSVPITYTTAANMGSILVDTDLGVGLGLRRHVILIEDSTGIGELVSYTPNLRSVATFAKLLVANTTQSNPLVDVYILPAGETIEEGTLPFLNGLVIGLSPITIPMPEGDFDIYVTPDDDTVPLAGPVPVTTAFGDVWQMLIYENVDPAVVDVVINQLP